MSTREGRRQFQGTREGRRRDRQRFPTPLQQPPDNLLAPVVQEEKLPLRVQIQRMRDNLLQYLQDEVNRVWRQMRSASDLEDADMRLPQSLDQFGRVVAVFDTASNVWFDWGDFARESKSNTFTATNLFSGTLDAQIFDQQQLVDIQSVWDPAGTVTTTAQVRGLHVHSTLSANHGATYGIMEAGRLTADANDTSTHINQVRGVYASAWNTETTAGTLTALFADVQGYNDYDYLTGLLIDPLHNGGTGDTASAIYIQGMGVASGSITDFYGLYIGTPTGVITNTYGIYQAGTDVENVFKGSLDVTGDAVIDGNTYSTVVSELDEVRRELDFGCAQSFRTNGSASNLFYTPTRSLGDGITRWAMASKQMPPGFKDGTGTLTLEVYIMHDAAKASTVTYDLGVRACINTLSNPNTTVGTDVSTQDVALNNSTGAIRTQVIRHTTTGVDLSSYDALSWRFQRQGGHANDTYTGSVHVWGAKMIFEI